MKAKTSESTRNDSIHSPSSYRDPENWSKINKAESPVSYSKMVTSMYGHSLVKDVKKGMVKIRSSKNVLRVYNPFPTPMAEML